MYNKITIPFLFRQALIHVRRTLASSKGSAAYWTVHMVTDDNFRTAEESLRYFHWRNAQYPGYIELMPVTGQDGKVVLDYGCGPGNDIVGFAVYSNPSKLIGVDVSKTALAKAKERLTLHGKKAEFMLIDEVTNTLPIPSESVDYIHTSGVLHHCANLGAVLKEFHRILKPGGEVSVMVYNYQSIWLHLYVAWRRRLKMGKNRNMSLMDAFRISTDGNACPISHCYKPEEFLNLMRDHRFHGVFKGASMSDTEMKCLPERFDAIGDQRLPDEHRDFLGALTFDQRGFPLYRGDVAGINACYSFKKI